MPTPQGRQYQVRVSLSTSKFLAGVAVLAPVVHCTTLHSSVPGIQRMMIPGLFQASDQRMLGLTYLTKSPTFIYHIQCTISKKMGALSYEHTDIILFSGFIPPHSANYNAGFMPKSAGVALFIYLH
jgi:hypothetical protein